MITAPFQLLPESTVALRNESEIICPFEPGDEIITITRAVTDSPALLIKKRVVSQIIYSGHIKVCTDDGFQFTVGQCYCAKKLQEADYFDLGKLFNQLITKL